MKSLRILCSYGLAVLVGYQAKKLRSKLLAQPAAHVPSEPVEPRETDRPASPPVELMLSPVPPVQERSHVQVPSSNENPRPLRGREKFREQRHLAHCSSNDCALSQPDQCPVMLKLSPGYGLSSV